MDGVNLNAADLATMVGASAAALVIAQFAKMLFTLPPAVVRTVAMLAGLAVMVAATLLTSVEITILGIVLSVIVGMQAGLAAAAAVDVTRDGIDYRVHPAPPTPGE